MLAGLVRGRTRRAAASLEEARGLGAELARLPEAERLARVLALVRSETAAVLGLSGPEAVPAGEGAMAAIIGLDRALVFRACEEAREAGPVQVANLNAPGQTVIAGATAAVKRAAEIAKG
jgi:malonyl CoA-acyl carrier protein transacylase